MVGLVITKQAIKKAKIRIDFNLPLFYFFCICNSNIGDILSSISSCHGSFGLLVPLPLKDRSIDHPINH
jgi:hypothetical protein